MFKYFNLSRPLFNSLLLIITCILLLVSCGKSDVIKIVGTNFQDEVPLRTNFEFRFSKSIAADSIIGVMIDHKLMNFDPEIEGTFAWSQDNILVFHPAQKLPPATQYSVRISKEFSKHYPAIKLDNAWSETFSTPMLSLESIEGYWGENKNNENLPGMYLTAMFNHKISPNDLAGKITFSVDNTDQSYIVEEEDPSRELTFYLPQVVAEDKKYQVDMHISSDLTPLDGNINIGDDLDFSRVINSPFVVEITGINSEHTGSEGTIRIMTSQMVKKEDFEKKFNIDETDVYEIYVEDKEVKIVSSKFDASSTYNISIEKGLQGRFGGELKTAYEYGVSFAEVSPTIAFLDEKNIYLSKNGKRNIEANIVNIKNVNLKIYKVYENNIIQYLNDNSYYDDYYYYDYDDDYGYSGDKNKVGYMGDLVYEEKINPKDLQGKGINKLLNINFQDKLSTHDGIYQLVLTSDEDYWVNAKKTVSISDIGLIVKMGPRSVSVFANSIETAEPLSSVDVKLVGRNNQVNARGKTNAEGVAVFDLEKLPAENFYTTMVTAKKGDDYNYIYPAKSAVNISRYDIGGYRENPSGMMTYVYPERDIYRPGETLNIAAIVRNYRWETPKGIPVKFKLTSPNGKEMGSVRKKLNAEGGTEASFPLSTSSPTGTYVVTLLTANDVVLNNYYVKVEEFVPDRIKVATKMLAEEFDAGDEIELEIQADNLFGTPASNRKWESEMQLRRTYFSSKDFSDYNFSINQNYTYFENEFESGETDQNGHAEAFFKIDSDFENMGKLRGSIFTTVFDETGRPVNRNNSFEVHTQDVYYGIKYSDYYYKTNTQIEANLVAVDQDGVALPSAKAELTLIRHEYKSVLAQSGSYYRYRSVPKEVVLDEKVISLSGGENTYRFTPEISGRYEIRISKPGVSNHVSKTYYCYGWGSTNNSSFAIDNEGNIDIKLDKENYAVGDNAQILLSTPFSGKALITIESDKVIKHFYQETDKKSLEFNLAITEDMLPNVYVTATLFRPHAISDLPLTVAHGFAPIIIKDEKRKIPVEILTVEKSRSKTKQKITLKGEPNSLMTVAVVDEGILQITGFDSPDPFSYFYQKRALETTSHNVYPYLFPEVSTHSGKPGGGDGGDDKRLNPMTNKRFSLVSYWSGLLETDSKGEVEYEIEIPQFSGSLRIMAVDYKQKSFGMAEKNMIVADPIVLSTGIPRFLSPGDTLVMPLTITNTTNKQANAKTDITLEGPLTLVKGTDDKLKISKNAEGRQVFKIVAGNALGECKITADVNALGETFSHVTNISIRPASPLQKRSGAGSVDGGTSKNLPMETSGFLDQTIGKKLVLSRSPMVKFTKDIDYLIGYPHGCVEQTVSKAFPQLYFESMIKDMGLYSNNVKSASHNVKQAIIRLQTMQLYNGGYSYWPGHGSDSWWGSVQATHFLVEAKKAGYDVPETMLNLSLDYLAMKIKSREYEVYYYNGYQKKNIIPKSALYSVYILALANQPDKSMMNYYKSEMKSLALDSKYLLAGAYQLTGDDKSFYEILPKAFEGEKAEQSLGGSFYSYVRDEAIALNVLLETDPENPQINYMAKHVAEQLSTKRYLNTQERLFGFLAMGKLAKRNEGNTVTAKVKVNGKSIYDFNGKTTTLVDGDLLGGEVEVEAENNGELYYFWETEGIDKEGNYKEEDNYLSVRKTFYYRNGGINQSGVFNQNDLIIVKISIRSLTNKTIENVVISDILPAGFEIENPRLNDMPEYTWIKNKNYPDYQDIRDDRINLYDDIGSRDYQNYYYMVRAVSPGTYFMGPVGADAMYNGEYNSYSGAQWIEIQE